MSANHSVEITLSFEQLSEFIQAAHDAEKFLYDNCGTNADWPIRLTTDNPATAQELADKLQRLRMALAPIRPPQP